MNAITGENTFALAPLKGSCDALTTYLNFVCMRLCEHSSIKICIKLFESCTV